MKSYKKAAALGLCVLLVLAACVGCGKGKDTEPDTLSDEELVSSDTQELVYKNGTYTQRFYKDEDGIWLWKDDTTLPLDQDEVQALLDEVSALNQLAPVTVTGDIATYDLESPDRTLEITNTDGTGLSLQIGIAAEGGGYYMCRDADTSKIYIAPEALVQMMDRSIYELVQMPDVPALKAEQLQSVTATAASGSAVTVAAGTDAYEKLAALLAEGSWLVSCVDYNPSSGALPVCGLDTPRVAVTVVYTATNGTDTTLTVTVGSAYGDGYYATYNDTPAIFKISADTAAVFCGLLEIGG